MRKSKIRECSYTILLSFSLLVVGCIWQFGGLKNQKPSEVSHFLENTTEDFFSMLLLKQSVESVSAELSGKEALPSPGEVRMETAEEMTAADYEGMNPTGEMAAADYEGRNQAGETTDTSDGVTDLAEGADEAENAAESQAVFLTDADNSYFDDALFIGDSRTVGLYEYGGLGNAEVFADSGMSVYKLFDEEFVLRSGEKTTLEAALSQKQFGKIYIMLGINELGYDFEHTVARFGDAIDRIQNMQKDAIIFIQANLHITKEKSEESDVFNNENIDRYNEAIHKFADEKSIFYLDSNFLYDDADGCLSKEFTVDHAHILGKYYVEWVDYILQNAISKSGT